MFWEWHYPIVLRENSESTIFIVQKMLHLVFICEVC